MTRFATAFIALVASALLLGGPLGAQTASDSLIVTANNAGRANFSIDAAIYNFGTVFPSGATNIGGTQVLTGVRNATGAVYAAAAATTFNARSAPPRTIRIHNASVASILQWGTADRLEMQIPITNLPAAAVSCGYKTFTTIGDGGAATCDQGNLIRGLSAGMGINERNGNLDFRLTVDDTDATGTNVWVVTLTAVGL